MRLAQALLDAGEKQVVLDYFSLCAKFWESPLLKQWRQQVEAGETPDFDANLQY